MKQKQIRNKLMSLCARRLLCSCFLLMKKTFKINYFFSVNLNLIKQKELI